MAVFVFSMACFSRWKGNGRLLSCGRCIGCRLEKSRQWAVRCMHESKLHKENCFVTLTYADNPISLVPRDLQLFWKRLRKLVPDRKIRYFAGGEYGEEKRRPHYHACLFGFDFADRVYYRKSGAFDLDTSALLARAWPHGFSTVADFSFETAAYVARYVCEKVDLKGADDMYEHIDLETGEITPVHPEFGRMSLRPGIGADWYKKFSSDVFPSDEVIVNGRVCRPPRYYDKLLRKQNAGAWMRLAQGRHEKAMANEELLDDNGRLYSKEVVARARLGLKVRTF